MIPKRRAILAVVAALLFVGALGYAGGVAEPGTPAEPSIVDRVLAASPLADAPADASGADDPPFAFESVAEEAGLDYAFAGRNAGEGDVTPSQVGNAGVYVTDYNRDGWADVLAIGGRRPQLFENTGGEFRPADALPPLDGQMRTALFADVDGDGRDDLLLFTMNSTPVLLENVGGEFEKRDAGFEKSLAVPTAATADDFDGDGCVDLFVAQNGNWDREVPMGIHNYSVKGIDNGNPNYLYRGNCSGSVSFERATDTNVSGTRWSLAASAGDLTGDGAPDVHVANDFNYDILYRNDGDGNFEQVWLPERSNQNGMSSELFDFNGDRRLDVFVTNIYLPDRLARGINEKLVWKNDGNTLLVNRGNGEFVDRARENRAQKGGWGWATVVTDFDNDGDEDLVHSTSTRTFQASTVGLRAEAVEKYNDMPMYSRPVVREARNGTFHKLAAADVGLEPADGRGLARLDYDHDGEMELVLATTSEFAVYDNAADAGNAVQVRVESQDGTVATGAEVTVTADGRTQWRTVRRFTDLLSQDQRLVHVGVGDAEAATVTVAWPDGTTRTVEGVPADRRLVVRPSGVVENATLSGTAA